MTEIAHLFESALRENRSSLLRKAAMTTVARMSGDTTLKELLQSDAREAIRELTLREFGEALLPLVPTAGLVVRSKRAGKRADEDLDEAVQVWPESREEKIYKQILDAVAEGPRTIGQMAKDLEVDVDELRGYLTWMKRMGKIASSGRARATRYFVPR